MGSVILNHDLKRVLSPRVLYFTNIQLYWECSALAASETFPSGIPQHMREAAEHTSFKRRTAIDALKGPFNPDHKAALAHWRISVETFSSASLTYESDKLIAISGVARELYKILNCRYLAGLWHTDLIHQLAW